MRLARACKGWAAGCATSSRPRGPAAAAGGLLCVGRRRGSRPRFGGPPPRGSCPPARPLARLSPTPLFCCPQTLISALEQLCNLGALGLTLTRPSPNQHACTADPHLRARAAVQPGRAGRGGAAHAPGPQDGRVPAGSPRQVGLARLARLGRVGQRAAAWMEGRGAAGWPSSRWARLLGRFGFVWGRRMVLLRLALGAAVVAVRRQRMQGMQGMQGWLPSRVAAVARCSPAPPRSHPPARRRPPAARC